MMKDFNCEMDFHPVALRHDAISLWYKSKDFKTEARMYVAYNGNYKSDVANLAQHVGAFQIQNQLFNVAQPVGAYYSTTGAQPYQNLQILWGRIKFGRGHSLLRMLNNLGFQNAKRGSDDNVILEKGIYFMQTNGVNWEMRSRYVDASLQGFYQSGQNIQAQRVNTYMFAGYIAFKDKSRIYRLGSNYLSGAPTNKEGQFSGKAFDPLYGSHHGFYGYMDYFYLSPNSNQSVGLWDKYISIRQVFNRVIMCKQGHIGFIRRLHKYLIYAV